MKKNFFPVYLLILAVLIMSAFPVSQTKHPVSVKWLTWEDAYELNKQQPKKILVNVYTNWDIWSKHLDKNTYSDTEIVKYLNENMYCVKLDAEMTKPIEFNGHKFEFIKKGEKGVHALAYSLLDGNLSYPSNVYLTEKYERILNSPGYKTPSKMMAELKFVAEEVYKNKSFDDYTNNK